LPAGGGVPRPDPVLSLGLVLAVLAVGCASSSGGDAAVPRSGEGRSVVVGSAAACTPPSAIALTRASHKLPAGMSFPAGSRLLQVEEEDGVTTVVAESRQTISALQQLFRGQLRAAGREIIAEDNEGREAELYFSVPGGGLGILRQSLARCPVGVTRWSVTVS
jgi:hypothetical protein